jgi:hypothetical protein
LIVSAGVVGVPCGKPLYVFSVPFARALQTAAGIGIADDLIGALPAKCMRRSATRTPPRARLSYGNVTGELDLGDVPGDRRARRLLAGDGAARGAVQCRGPRRPGSRDMIKYQNPHHSDAGSARRGWISEEELALVRKDMLIDEARLWAACSLGVASPGRHRHRLQHSRNPPAVRRGSRARPVAIDRQSGL